MRDHEEDIRFDDLLTPNDENINLLKTKLSQALKLERLLVSFNLVRLGEYKFGVIEDRNYNTFKRLIKSEDESYTAIPISFKMFVNSDYNVDLEYHSIKTQHDFDAQTQAGLKNCESLQMLLDELYKNDSEFLVRLRSSKVLFEGYLIYK